MEHTPIPWRVSGCHMEQPRSENIHLLVEHGDESTSAPLIAEVYMDSDRLPTEANAAFIVRAVNNHAALLKALKATERGLIRALDNMPYLFPTNGQSENMTDEQRSWRVTITAMKRAAHAAIKAAKGAPA